MELYRLSFSNSGLGEEYERAKNKRDGVAEMVTCPHCGKQMRAHMLPAHLLIREELGECD